MIHVDAHSDTNDRYFGDNLYTHGTPFRRAVEEGLLDPKRVIQIGIRGSIYSEDDMAFAEGSGMRVVYMEEFAKLGVERVIAEARRVSGEGPCYISFDVDGLDPVYAPGTGTPEIGGLTTLEAQHLIRGLEGLNLVGGDVVEVSPPFDPSGNTALVGRHHDVRDPLRAGQGRGRAALSVFDSWRSFFVIPAKAGIQGPHVQELAARPWIPAFAGMTEERMCVVG